MKLVLVFASFFMSTSVFADGYVCMTTSDHTPSDVYIIDVLNKNTANVTYQRYPFFGAEIVVPTQEVPGCMGITMYELNLDFKSLYVECAGDGDAGFFVIPLEPADAVGAAVFPEGNIGYKEDTALKLTCHKK